MVGAAGPEAGSPLLLTELSHLGGALGRPAEDGGALSTLDAHFVLLGIGVPMTLSWARRCRAPSNVSTTRWSRGRPRAAYFNFAERPCDVDALLPPETCERLAEVKRRWDPDGPIRANHAVSLTPA